MTKRHFTLFLFRVHLIAGVDFQIRVYVGWFKSAFVNFLHPRKNRLYFILWNKIKLLFYSEKVLKTTIKNLSHQTSICSNKLWLVYIVTSIIKTHSKQTLSLNAVIFSWAINGVNLDSSSPLNGIKNVFFTTFWY